MPTGRQGSIRLFRFSGIDVFLHWSWFLVAVYEIQTRAGGYSSVAWNILEYVCLFLIVTLHEFGHALACRQVGGRANQIVLWPLGGIAYVDPPPRPGATLWSIAAGPLVNVVLLPVLWGIFLLAGSLGWATSLPDFYNLIDAVLWINVGLLVFNIIPIYPLDGGQILRSLLWFVIGRAWSLMVAAVLGLLGAAGFIILAIYRQNAWLGVVAAFVLLNCWGGFKNAQALLRLSKLPRRHGYSCPTCKTSPPLGAFWRCRTCGKAFDTFESRASCPFCSAQYPNTQCLDCGNQHPFDEWATKSTIDVPSATTVGSA